MGCERELCSLRGLADDEEVEDGDAILPDQISNVMAWISDSTKNTPLSMLET